MAFEDRLMAKIRDVEFSLDIASGTSGRRAVPHSYPKRETGYAEDNGAVFTKEKIEGRIVGADYLDRFKALLIALNEPGPCELVHPWFGVVMVQIGEVNHKLKLGEDGLATFSFEALNAGESLFPNASVNTAEAVQAAAAEARAAAQAAFARTVLNAKKTTIAAAGLGELFDQALDDFNEFTRAIPSLPDDLKAWTSRLEAAKAAVGNLLAVPGELAAQGMSLLEDVKGLVTDPIQALAVYDNVQSRWDGMRAELAVRGGLGRSISAGNGVASSVQVVSDTDTITAQAINIASFNTLLSVSSLIEKADAMASSDFTTETDIDTIDSITGTGRSALMTGSQLTEIGNSIATNLNAAAEVAVEDGNSELWRSLRTLRSAVLEDTRIRAKQLPQLSIITPSLTIPVALLAWQQTGSAENRASIINRNGLANPAFLQAGKSVELING